MRFFITSIVVALFIWPTNPLGAQDLGPHLVKLKDGIFVYAKDVVGKERLDTNIEAAYRAVEK